MEDKKFLSEEEIADIMERGVYNTPAEYLTVKDIVEKYGYSVGFCIENAMKTITERWREALALLGDEQKENP